jgi:hypothetical protein
MVAAANRNVYLNVQCRKCRDIVHLNVNERDVVAWRNGRSIQDAMPYLTPDEREILISGICGPCFDAIFSPEESEDE